MSRKRLSEQSIDDELSSTTPDIASMTEKMKQMPILTSMLFKAIPVDVTSPRKPLSSVSGNVQEKSPARNPAASEAESKKKDDDDDELKSSKKKGPRCGVCNVPNRSTYYGLMVCDSCCMFFTRCIRDCVLSELECKNNNMCRLNITTETQENCKKCMLNKCLDVGMDPDRLVISKKSLTEYVTFVYHSEAPRDTKDPTKIDPWKRLDEVLHPAVTNIGAFALRMPGFCRLSMHDKCLLVQHSFLDVMAIFAAIDYDSASETLTTFGGHRLKRSTEKLISRSYGLLFDDFFDKVAVIASYQLDKKALLLLAGMLVFRSDYFGALGRKLKDADVVCRKQKEFYEALEEYKPKSSDFIESPENWKGFPWFVKKYFDMHDDIVVNICKVKGITKTEAGTLVWELFAEGNVENE